MILLRIGQWVLVVAVLVLALLDLSAITILMAAFVVMLALAELAVADLDPYKQLRHALSWWPAPGFVGWAYRRIFGIRKSSPQPVFRAKADVLIDERQLRSAVRQALGHLDEALGAPVSLPPPPPPDFTLLRLLQQLLGSTLSGDINDLHQTLQIEMARLRRQLEIEVSNEWTPDQLDHWETRESTAVTSPEVVLPAVWQKDRVVQGVVYLPLSKEARP